MESTYSGLTYMRHESAFDIWSNWVKKVDASLDRRILAEASEHYGIIFRQEHLTIDLERECGPEFFGESRVWEISHLWKRGFSTEQIIERIDWEDARHAEWLRRGKPRDESYWTIPAPGDPETSIVRVEQQANQEQDPETIEDRIFGFFAEKPVGYNRGIKQLAADLQASVEEIRWAVDTLLGDSKLEKIQNGQYIAYRLKQPSGMLG